MASAQVIVVGDRLYVVDSGDGVARQLVLAGLSLSALRHVFITHHHSDHNADYGNLLLLAWASGRRDRVDTWGPAPIAQITRLFLEMSATDIDTRIVDEGPAAARAAAARARAHPTRCGLAGRRRQSDRRVCQVPHG
jgi:ribonuclease BN (tRNA processing enzyme)